MHIITVSQPRLQETLQRGGCGYCRVSCQSACKTSITVSNQACENGQRTSSRPSVMK
ncbi:six-cysteine ranthipeptide SCIFF [Thermanaeromonas sp. C210]|uniref:six-cysteine ranthipeptide SCIFF n=1 Tax=Thermanaeromonas sp. C210 TaxID=2731925 RepID=UPI0024143E9C|nr:six-cysteine ranthipeptide SCIFF [Thermanaeromonas sp. C210]